MTRWIPVVLIIALLVAFRILGSVFPESLPNFQPLTALFFCGALLAGAFATPWRAFLIPLSLWAVTYPAPAILQGNAEFLNPAVVATTLMAFALTYALGLALAKRGTLTFLGGSLAAALVFHLVTNTAAWIGNPLYDASLAGLWQSLWLGRPGDVLPSWVFFRNLACANLLFTAIFLIARARIPVGRSVTATPSTVTAG